MSTQWNDSWLALMIGNSRSHWAWFVGDALQLAWDTPHLSREAIAKLTQTQLDFSCCPEARPAAGLLDVPARLPLYLASVVSAQTQLWQVYALTQLITLADVPLQKLYSTLGVDRALAALGAAKTLGLPALVIDAGTALTLTGVNAQGQFMGGAILPGVQLQLRSLSEHTAALPALQAYDALPPRWASSTSAAIHSGVLYTLLAGLQEFSNQWLQAFPESRIVLTGGDRLLLLHGLQQQYPRLALQLKLDPDLIFWGMAALRKMDHER